jgi:hypothetical protein
VIDQLCRAHIGRKVVFAGRRPIIVASCTEVPTSALGPADHDYRGAVPGPEAQLVDHAIVRHIMGFTLSDHNEVGRVVRNPL